MRQGIFLAIIGGLLALGGAILAPEPAWAQNDALQFILDQARQRQRQVRPVAPQRAAAPRILYVPRRAPPSAPVVIVRDSPDKVKVEPAIFVTVFGDSMGEFLGGGLEEALAVLPDVAVTRRTRSESGLVRADFYDWPKSVVDYFATSPKINFAVMQIGVNDRQAIRDESGQVHEPGSERWRVLYGQRVESMARLFTERQVALIWVGLPPMPYASYSAAVKEINEITRQNVNANGGQFIDIWDSFSDNDGRYAAFGPDLNGQTARLRASDGVHFNKTGARKAAHFVEIELRRLFGNRAPTSVIALPTEPSAVAPQPVEAPPVPVEKMIDAMVAGRADMILQVHVPIKPVAGPIVPLNRPASAKDGLLVTRASAPASLLLHDNALDHGRPPQPKPGRADDFAWPPR